MPHNLNLYTPRLQSLHVLRLFSNRRFKIQIGPEIALLVDLQGGIVQLEKPIKIINMSKLT